MQDIKLIDGIVIATLSGKIYVDEAAAIRGKLLEFLELGHSNFVINLSNVDYIDSSGLGVLVAIQKRALEHKGGVVIQGLHGAVQLIFELTRLTRVFEVRK